MQLPSPCKNGMAPIKVDLESEMADLVQNLGLASPKRIPGACNWNFARPRLGKDVSAKTGTCPDELDLVAKVLGPLDIAPPQCQNMDGSLMMKLKADELHKIVVKLGSASCADALWQHDINGEALTAILEKDQEKATDLLLEMLPKSIPIGERLIFIRRLREQFQDAATPPDPVQSISKPRNASRLLSLLVLSYLAWTVYGILTAEPVDEVEVLDTQSSAMEHMYSWLGWSPELGSPCHQSMQTHFEGAMPSRAVVERVKESLVPFGMSASNTIYAEATCSDEINHEPQRLGSIFTEVWGSVFTMGGIGGFPYGGQAALGAFSGHVPDGGNMFILYGPHVGVSESGDIGAVLRSGQHKCTTACGALMGVYKNCLNGLNPSNYSKVDAQARFIHEALALRLDEIKTAESPEAMLPRVAFDVAHEMVMAMTKKMKLGSGYLVLLGGIQINTPDKFEDAFLPMHFSIQSQDLPMRDLTHSFDVSALEDMLAATVAV